MTVSGLGRVKTLCRQRSELGVVTMRVVLRVDTTKTLRRRIGRNDVCLTVNSCQRGADHGASQIPRHAERERDARLGGLDHFKASRPSTSKAFSARCIGSRLR